MTANRPMAGMRGVIIAARAFALPASLVPVLLGVAIAYHMGYPVRWLALGVTLAGMVAIHVASNLLNDCYDHRRGLDIDVRPFSGAVVRGMITERQAQRTAYVCLGVGIVCGLFLVRVAGPMVLVLGMVGVALTLTYTTGRFGLKYAGLGDAAIFLAFGVLPVFGSYWVQAQRFSWSPIVWSFPLVLVTVGILHANNWRDMVCDGARGCRTVARLLGERGSRGYYRFLVLTPFALITAFVVLCLIGAVDMTAPVTTLVVLVLLPATLRLTRIDRSGDRDLFRTLDGQTAQLQLKLGVLLSAALILSRHLPAPW